MGRTGRKSWDNTPEELREILKDKQRADLLV